MTSSIVAEAKVQILGDMGTFAESTEAMITKVLDELGIKIDDSTGTISKSFSTVGEAGGSAFAAAVATAGTDAVDQLSLFAVDGTAPAVEAFGTAGTEAGAAFGEGTGVGIETSSAETEAAIDTTAAKASAEARAKFAEAGAKAGESFGEGAKDTIKGLAGTLLPLVGALGAAELVKGAVEQADQLEGSQEKIESVFGESADKVASWAKSVQGSLRLSTSEAETSAGTFGQFIHSMGIGGDQAADMAIQLTSLTQNMAKFNNADPAAVQNALTSALRGRATAMKQYGVSLDATSISAAAVAHGLVSATNAADPTKIKFAQDTLAASQAALNKVDKDAKSTAVDKANAQDKVTKSQQALTAAEAGAAPVLTAQQKAEATYYAIMDQTKNQQDALGKSTNTLAQQKAMLAAEVDNVEASLGSHLLPILTKVMMYFTTTAIPAIISFGHWIQQNKAWLEPLVVVMGAAYLVFKLTTAAVGGLNKVMGLAGDVMKLFGVGTEAATVATEGETAAQEGLNVALDANPIGLIVTALVLLAAGLYEAWQHSATFRDIVLGAWSDVKTVVMAVWADALKPTFDAILIAIDFVVDHWKLFATALLIIMGPLGITILAGVALAAEWHNIMAAIEAAWSATMGALKAAWDTVGAPIFTVIEDIVKVLIAIFTIQLILFLDAWIALWGGVEAAWKVVGKPLFDAIGKAVALWWSTIVKPQIDAVKAAWAALWAAAAAAWNTVGKPAINAVNSLVASVMGQVRSAINTTVGVIDGIGSAFSGVYNTAYTWVSRLLTLVSGIAGTITGYAGSMITAGTKFIGGLWTGITSYAGSAASDIGGDIERAVNKALGLPRNIGGWKLSAGPLHYTFPTITIPGLADGATVMPRSGGTVVALAEAGKPESVVDTGGMNSLISKVTSQLDRQAQPMEKPTYVAYDARAQQATGPTPEQWDALIAAVQDAASGPRSLTVNGQVMAQVVNDANLRSQRRR